MMSAESNQAGGVATVAAVGTVAVRDVAITEPERRGVSEVVALVRQQIVALGLEPSPLALAAVHGQSLGRC